MAQSACDGDVTLAWQQIMKAAHCACKSACSRM